VTKEHLADLSAKFTNPTEVAELCAEATNVLTF
jgi:hypothetical protein